MKKSLFTLYLTILFPIVFGYNTTLSQCAINVGITEGNTLSICPEVDTHLNATAGMQNYHWSGAVTATDNRALITGAGWVHVSAMDDANCLSKDSILISYFLPDLNPSILSNNGDTLCVGGISILTASATDPISYEWNTGSTSSTLDISGPGEYWVKVTDMNGCFMMDTIEIYPTDFSMYSSSGDSICLGYSTTLIASGGTSYIWSNGQTTPQITVSPSTSSAYSVTIYRAGCSELFPVLVNVIQLPPHTMPDTLFLFPGDKEYITAPPTLASYNWQPSNIVTAETGVSTGFRGTESAVINFTGVDVTGKCQIEHNIYVMVINLTIPEGFSPNNDGKNDYFVIPEILPLNAKLKVWNRWGDIVYKSDSYSNNWDGTCQSDFCMGKGDLPDGTYFYTIEVKGKTITGNITLKR